MSFQINNDVFNLHYIATSVIKICKKMAKLLKVNLHYAEY